jgi:hypothetical protein
VKVGHRQTPYTPAGINPPALKTPSQKEGVFYCPSTLTSGGSRQAR